MGKNLGQYLIEADTKRKVKFITEDYEAGLMSFDEWAKHVRLVISEHYDKVEGTTNELQGAESCA